MVAGSLPSPTVIGLAWSSLGIPLGASVGTVPRLTTLETDIASSGCGVAVPRRGAGRSFLEVLWKVRARHRLTRTRSLRCLLILLSGALVLVLEWCPLR